VYELTDVANSAIDDVIDDDDAARIAAEASDEAPNTTRSERLKQRRISNTGGTTVGNKPKRKHTTAGNNLSNAGAPKRLLAQQKRRDAVELRKMGLSYQKIADAVGYSSAQEAGVQVNKAFKEIIHEPVVELRGLQIERLNHLLSVAWQQASAGSLAAINTCAALMARIDALSGTEAPVAVSVVTNNTSVITVNSDQDDFVASMKRFLNVQADGTNKAAIPPITQNAIAAQPHAVAVSQPNYPPGMGPIRQRQEVVEDAVVIEDALVEEALEVAGTMSLEDAAEDLADAQVVARKKRSSKKPGSVPKKFSVQADVDDDEDD
jgi:hypothetical protein